MVLGDADILVKRERLEIRQRERPRCMSIANTSIKSQGSRTRSNAQRLHVGDRQDINQFLDSDICNFVSRLKNTDLHGVGLL